MKTHTSLMLAGLLGLALLWHTPARADSFQIGAYQENSSTAEGTLRATGLRARWIALPGYPLGQSWFLRPGVELGFGRMEHGGRHRSYWQVGGLAQLYYPGDSVDFYLQGGVGSIQLSGGHSQDPLLDDRLVDDDIYTQAEIGIRLHEGVRLDLGLRYQEYRDSGMRFQGIVIGLGF